MVWSGGCIWLLSNSFTKQTDWLTLREREREREREFFGANSKPSLCFIGNKIFWKTLMRLLRKSNKQNDRGEKKTKTERIGISLLVTRQFFVRRSFIIVMIIMIIVVLVVEEWVDWRTTGQLQNIWLKKTWRRSWRRRRRRIRSCYGIVFVHWPIVLLLLLWQ